MNIKKGDQVKIISGNDKGKHGKVLSVFPAEGRLVVEGVNMRKKHMRPRKQGQKGELIRIAGSMTIARAMLICSKCNKPTRIGIKVEDGKRHRICKKCGGEA